MKLAIQHKRAALLVFFTVMGGALPGYAADAPAHVELALGDVSLNKVPFLIAADNGIYARNGLDVHQFITPGAAKAVASSGVNVPADFVGSNKDSAAAPIEIGGGAPMIKGVASKPDVRPHVIVSTTENIFHAHLIATSAITSIEDMKGKRIGAGGGGSVFYYGFVGVVKKLGWELDKDVTQVSDAQDFDFLKAGKVDGFTAQVMLWAMVDKTPYKDVGDLAQYRVPVAGSGIMVDSQYLAANHDTVARFVKATVEATALMKKDRKLFNAALAKWFNITDPKVQAIMFTEAKIIPDKPYPSREGVEGAMSLYDTPLLRQHKPTDFYDMSFIADLDKSGYLDKLAH